MRGHAPWLAVLTLLLVLGGVVVALSQRAPRLSGTNDVLLGSYVAQVPPGKTLCHTNETLPHDTAAVQVFAGVYGRPGPPLSVSVTHAGRLLAAGRAPGGYPDGQLRIRVSRVTRDVAEPRVCLTNRGRSRLALGGLPGPPAGADVVSGRPQAGQIRIEYLRPGRETWWALLPTIARRFSFTRAGFAGPWLLWAGLVALAVAWALSFRLLGPPRR